MARQTVLDVFGRIYPNATPEMIDYKFRLAQVRCGYHYPSIWYHLLAAKKKNTYCQGLLPSLHRYYYLIQMAGQLSGLMEVGVELSFRTTLLQYLEKK